MYSEKTYQGRETVVVAMDIGTTQISFAHFIPKTHPRGQTVNDWPESRGAVKIPSIVSYRDGVFKACGAEALQDFEEHQEDVAYWFKLYLHPPLISESNSSEIPPLPEGTTIERVYADMMKYLMEHTRRFFENRTPNGAEIWARVRDTIVIVLATPNGWYIREQSILRKAAILASLVTEENAGQLLQFVTEAEASVHYAVDTKHSEWLRKRTIFAVIDCGGSTVDSTVYRCVSTTPLSLTETCPSGCVQAGGVFVDRGVENMLKRKLEHSAFGDQEAIRSMVDAFEKQIKPKFDGITEEYTLKFGSSKDNDARLGISRGKITLSNKEILTVFDPVVNRITKSCSEMVVSQKAEYVLIVGGFGESPYLQKVLLRLLPRHIQVVPVGDPMSKAVAYVTNLVMLFVVARVARATFGGCVFELYNKTLHRERNHAVQVYADGKRRVDGAFHAWIKKGTALQGTFAYKLPYHVAWDASSTSKTELGLKLGAVEIEVFAWEGDDIPKWCKDEHGAVMKGMRLICTLNADLSALAGALEVQIGPRGKVFYRVDYTVCVYFGGTQLHANLQWKEKGHLREGPVAVMPFVS